MVGSAIHRTLPRAWPLLVLGLAGCGTLGQAVPFDPSELDSTPGWTTVPAMPVVLQREKTDCGTASLCMVLNHWNVASTLEDVSRECPSIPEQGTKAKDLRDFARGKGLTSYLIHGCWEDLKREIGQGHPVIVGLVKLDGDAIITHYEVVVAIHAERDAVVTIDPARGWCRNSRSGFSSEWEPAGFLTLVFDRRDPPGPAAPRTGP